MNFRILFFSVALASTILVEPACLADDITETVRKVKEKQPPHIVIISLDTTRPDYLEPYGHKWVKTPHLAKFAEQAIVFEDCMAPAPTTLNSHTSVFTGLYGHSHGTPKNGFVVNGRNLTLTEILQATGYHTAGFIGAFPLHRRFNLVQGFDYFDDRVDRRFRRITPTTIRSERPAAEVTDNILEYFDGLQTEAPKFLFAHYFDPHKPYRPLPKHLAKYKNIPDELPEGQDPNLADWTKMYAAEISYLDEHLGRLFDGLRERKIYDNALIIITSDHGESIWDDEPFFEHGWNVYDSVIRAIGIVKLPRGKHAGTRTKAPITTIDWMPSILSYLDMPIPPNVEGIDLDFAGGEFDIEERDRFAEATKPGNQLDNSTGWYNYGKPRCIRTGDYKLVQIPEKNAEELYNIATDPTETKNLLEGDGEVPVDVDAMRERLETWAKTVSDLNSNYEESNKEDTIKQLEALGYLE